MKTISRSLNPRRFDCFRLAALVVSVVVVVKVGFSIIPDWHNIKGWEAYWIAKAVVSGEGFSMPSPEPWGFDVVDDGVFRPSAWSDPIYAFCLAGIIYVFGEYHQLAAGYFNLLLLLLVFLILYRLGESFITRPAGVLAVLILAFTEEFYQAANQMNATMLSAFVVVLSALMMSRFLKNPGYLSACVLGLMLGITALGCPSAQSFGIVAAVAVAVRGFRRIRPALLQAVLLLFSAQLAMLPWTLRNSIVLGEYVPVRTGAGWGVFQGVVSAGGTVEPGRLRSHISPPWRSGTPRLAIEQALVREKREALDRFQMDYARELDDGGFDAMNEAQRDSWFFREARTFVVENPALSMELAVAKIRVFTRAMGSTGVLVCFFAALGGALAIGTPMALILALWVLTFIGPFLLLICYYSRYRAPVEPLLVLLAVFAICRMLALLFRFIRNRKMN